MLIIYVWIWPKREEAQIKSNAYQKATTDEQENCPETKMDHTKSWEKGKQYTHTLLAPMEERKSEREKTKKAHSNSIFWFSRDEEEKNTQIFIH